jgi:hypothetical protein
MKKNIINNEMIKQIDKLPQNLQIKVFDLVKAIVNLKTQGVPGKVLLRFAGAIPPSDLKLMKQAIEEDCESVELNEW